MWSVSSHCKVVVLEENIETTKDVMTSGEQNAGQSDPYGSNPIVLITKQSKPIH